MQYVEAAFKLSFLTNNFQTFLESSQEKKQCSGTLTQKDVLEKISKTHR